MASYSSKSGALDSFASQMKAGVLNKEFADVKFVLGEQRKVVHGHRIIIALRCPLLHKLFQESSQKPEVPIILSDVNPETFQHMLDFMYTNTVQISQSSSTDLLGTAIEYGLQDLQRVVCEFMIESLDVDFAAEAMHAGVYFEVSALEARCLSFIAKHAAQFFRNKCYLEMGEEAFIKVIRCRDLDIEEMEINRAVHEWGRNAAIKSNQPISVAVARPVRHLRIALFDVEELEKVEAFSNKESGYIPADMFQFAWKLHAQLGSGRGQISAGENTEWASIRKGSKSLPHHKHLLKYSESDD